MKCPMCDGDGKRHWFDEDLNERTMDEPCPCCAYAEALAREVVNVANGGDDGRPWLDGAIEEARVRLAENE